ncbi:hypothetical protein B0H67DRAFT_596224 [Lasiosphaeris hirsuta]|uniref:Uncharacterized protein n=1 Tax=Lasiosphaeris hirsuta TaxID=260670 RepID=A0AA40EAC7_9PEZI|nr:hypothetical protein B0H67DRAFT_596224 [Lasiosphaeris hirsuta]
MVCPCWFYVATGARVYTVWRSVPCGLLAVAGIFTLWPDDQRTRYDTRTALSKIDFIGNILLVLASILLVFAIQEGASFVWSWSSPAIVWSLVISGICWILLGLWESYLCYGVHQKIQPIFPLRLAKGRVYLSSLIVTFLTGFVYISLVIKIPERFQINFGDNALWAGIHLLPMLGACAFGSFMGGGISRKNNLTSQTLVIGSSLQTLGIGLAFGFTRSDIHVSLLLGFTAIYGFGVGLCFAASTMIAAIEARHGDLAAAQGAVAQARVFGGALGLAICTVVFNQKLQKLLGPGSGAGFDDWDLGQIHRSPMAALSLPPDLSQLVKSVYLEAFRDQMLTMTIISALAVLVGFGTYQSRPAHVIDAMAYHKEFASRTNNTELESTSSIRSLVR